MKTIVYSNDTPITHYLIEKDSKLSKLFQRKKQILVTLSDDYFLSLVHTIIAQQLSSKVASVISKRLTEFYQEHITPAMILATDDDKLRPLGLSHQKIKYLKSLAECLETGKVHFNDMDTMSDQEVINMLIQIKGIGIWTAQMFLMFSLGREDVFSVLDLGLRNVVKDLYENQALTNQQIETISLQWAPYRSIVSHFLWHAYDGVDE
jgi:DNA-3-methyladenine glycosylase II